MKNDFVLVERLNESQEFYVSDNENKTFMIFLSDGQDSSGEIRIIIKGKDARVQILGIILGSGQQKINLYTLQDHLQERSVSDLFIKSVLFDESRLNYKGLIKIEKHAQKSNAYQKNQNLLMSKKSWADTRPELEILANDVRCTHGATVGKLDENQLYYLATRGLNKANASKLLVNGFLNEVVARIPDAKTAEELTEKIEEKVGKLLERN